MIINKYTDVDYVPMSKLSSLSSEVREEIKTYREKFSEVIKLDNLSFATIVETPILIKKRFIKNVELSKSLNLKVEDNDFILSFAIAIANGKNIKHINKEKERLLQDIYKENNNDLTIITTYLINELNVSNNKSNDIRKLLPGLSNNEIKFIKNNNDIRYNYSLQDFQALNKSSYETARKSLEKLANLELYLKEKVGKKFIYKPSNKLITLVKGGA